MRVPLDGSRERFCYASQIVEQDLHIVQSRPIIQDATTQGEATVERGVGEIRAAVLLQRDQQAFVEGIDLLRRLVPKLCWHMSKTNNRKLNRRDHFKVIAGLDHGLQIAGTCKITFDRVA